MAGVGLLVLRKKSMLGVGVGVGVSVALLLERVEGEAGWRGRRGGCVERVVKRKKVERVEGELWWRG